MRQAIFAIMLLCSWQLNAEVVHIAVAANFKTTLQEINAAFETQTGHTTRTSSASTGALHSQILHGAPYDIFFAADKNSPTKLAQSNLGVEQQNFCYAIGRLVLVGSEHPSIDLAKPELSVAIANPNTAPYGKAAWEVLQREKFKAANARKLVRGNNAIQAYQYWHSSIVDLALVPLSLAHREGAIIPPNWYTPIEQHVIWLKKGEENPAANAYMRWIHSEKVQAMIKNSGYGNCR